MDVFFLVMLLCTGYICTRLLALSRRRRGPAGVATLPPGPPAIPIIGNILELGKNPHVSLAKLARTYGPIMKLRLGSVTTIVVSSPKGAKEALHTHDHALSNRSVPDFIRAIGHDKYSMAFLPAAAQWKQLRKIAATKMLTSQRLDSTRMHRLDKVQKLLEFVRQSCRKGEAVQLGDVAFTTTMNLITTTLFSVDFAGYGSSALGEFHEAVTGLMEEAGKLNPVDFFPILGYLNLPFFGKRGRKYKDRLMRIFEDIIHERVEKRASGCRENNKDVLDSLLDIITEEKGYDFDERFLKHMLLDLFLAGIDTSSNTVEWVMTELLRDPEKMTKARAEIREVVGDNGQVQESDIARLPYLQAVVKETLRLHPPVPFLLPRKAEADVEICGHVVPKGAQVLINVWAMGRDSHVWDNARSFEPERFLEREMDVRGRNFEFTPFGGGRRICPGQPLAHRMMHLVVASLLCEFNWKLADGLTAEDVDMTDKFGITLHKAEPLSAIPIEI